MRRVSEAKTLGGMRPPLYHYSRVPMMHVGTVNVTKPAHTVGYMKPHGLWVSDDSDETSWPAWCIAEDFEGGYKFRYEIVLAEPERLLWLDHEGAIRGFAAGYEMPAYPELGDYLTEVKIDWLAVAKEYAGVVITPYCWELRLARDFMWYYGWDCASGVIWDGSVVAEVKPVPMIPEWAPKQLEYHDNRRSDCDLRRVVSALGTAEGPGSQDG